MTLVAGIDGCPGGWLRIEHDRQTNRVRANVFSTAAALVIDAASFAILAIDIPIGLSENGWRACDIAARRLLGPPRASSVFPAPSRRVLGANTYEEAVARSVAACGKKMSKQSFAILDRIAEVDRMLQASPALREKVREIHPEVCFYFLNGRRPMLHAKRSAAGAAERDALLATVFGSAFADVRSQIPKRLATDDDIRDALVATWTAGRIVDGLAESISFESAVDVTGLPMEMRA